MDVKAIITVVVLALVALGVTVWLGENATSKKGTDEPVKKVYSSFDDDSDAPPLDEDDRRPKAVADETSYQFGAMEVGQKKHHTFVIKNEGEDTLRIAKGASTCKCTVSELPNNEIPPGETAEVNLEWEPFSANPDFAQSARIWTNDPDHRKIDFRVEGQVTSLIEFNPGTDLDAGSVHEESGAKTTFIMYSKLTDQLTEPEIVCDKDWLTFATEKVPAAEIQQHNAKAGYRINIEVAPKIPVGVHKEVFEMNFKADGKDLHFDITLRCTRRGPVTIIPLPGTVFLDSLRLVDFQRFPASKGKKQAITIILDDPPNGEDIKLTVGEIENPNLKVSIEPNTQLALNKRQAFNVSFEIPPGLPPLDYSRFSALDIPIRTTHPVVEEILLRVEIHSY